MGRLIGNLARGLQATEALFKVTGETLIIQSVAVPMDDIASPLFNTSTAKQRKNKFLFISKCDRALSLAVQRLDSEWDARGNIPGVKKCHSS